MTPGLKIDTEIPVVDFRAFTDGDAMDRVAVAARICTVVRTLGFVYVSGIDIEQSDVDALVAGMGAFFGLPSDAKMTLARPRAAGGELTCGYVPQGREHEDSSTPSDIKEALDFYRGDSYYRAAFLKAAPSPAALAPELTALIERFTEFHRRCTTVAIDMLRAFAIDFKLPESYFVERHGQNNILRLLHYPPVSERVLDRQMRVGSHTDFGTLTLLFQDDTAGLEVLSAGGRWLPAPFIPGTVLINIGDLMQQWTNCVFRSTPHRVRVPNDRRASASRYSIAFFCEPNNDTEVSCLPLAHEASNPLFAPVIAGEHLLARLDRMLIEDDQ